MTLIFAGFFAWPVAAGNWGENWGSLNWGSGGGGPTVPAPPTIDSIEAIPGGLVVYFTPGSDGGAAIESFEVTCGSESNTGTASPITVDGLDGYTSYECSVTATNASGTSSGSTPVAAEAGELPRLNIILIKKAVDAQSAP